MSGNGIYTSFSFDGLCGGFGKLITESMSLITLESFFLVFCVKVLKNVTTWL
jgi:hypothetical protein